MMKREIGRSMTEGNARKVGLLNRVMKMRWGENKNKRIES